MENEMRIKEKLEKRNSRVIVLEYGWKFLFAFNI